jgi:hypothetical protein
MASPPPRIVRLKQGYRFWCALLVATCVIVPSLLLGFLIVERRANPAKQVMNSDFWSTVPFIALPLIFLLLASWISIGHRRLVAHGEVSIGKVIGVRILCRRPDIIYEFLDRSGRLITASSPDDTRSFSSGMVIPIFYNPESPETDQVALCGSAYEVAGTTSLTQSKSGQINDEEQAALCLRTNGKSPGPCRHKFCHTADHHMGYPDNLESRGAGNVHQSCLLVSCAREADSFFRDDFCSYR